VDLISPQVIVFNLQSDSRVVGMVIWGFDILISRGAAPCVGQQGLAFSYGQVHCGAMCM
jgi:hypothetical protein